MNGIKDKRGFSLVELIIAMAVMAILAGSALGAFGYINTGKTKKASAKLNSRLTYIQTETMAKEGRSYLYLYKKPDGVYYVVSNKDAAGNVGDTGLTDSSDLTALTSDGSKICDSSVTVAASSVSGNTVKLVELNTASASDEVDMIKIGYRKSTGAFSDSCAYKGSTLQTNASGAKYFYNEIKLSGKQHFSIKLVEKTGKHYVDR